MEKTKLTLPITILLDSVVLGAFYYSGEMARQQSTERQQAIKMEEDRKITEANIIQQQQEQQTEEKKEQADSLFQKNIECIKHKDAILKQEDQYNKNQKPEIRDSNNSGGDLIYNLYVEK